MELERPTGRPVSGGIRWRSPLEAMGRGSGVGSMVVEASDGSVDERARFLGRFADTMRVVQPLDGAGLGAIFGRDHVVHVAVAKGRLAETLVIETARYAGVSGQAVAMAVKNEHPAPPGDGDLDMQAGK